MDARLEKVSTIISPVDQEVVTVSFKGKGVLPDFSETYADAINSKIAIKGGSMSFDSAEILSYFNFLLKARIDKVNGKRIPSNARNLNIPALFAISLTHIGEVHDKDLGITLIPKLNTDEEVVCMTEANATKFSRKLTLVQDLGFELVQGIPFDRLGDVSFMYMTLAENSHLVRHNNEAHPGIAALTAFYRMEQLGNLLSFRVSYGLVSEYEDMLKGLIYDEAR